MIIQEHNDKNMCRIFIEIDAFTYSIVDSWEEGWRPIPG